MKTLWLIVLAALPALASIPSLSHVAYASPRSYFEARVDLSEEEQPRIHRHLAAVEAELRARPVSHLTESQRRNRLARLDDLHTYWTRGEFPQNRDFPDRLIPYFIDAEGVPCAMGYLVIQSGHGDYAEEIRQTRNNAYIAEIAAADARLAAWVEAEGMTLEEAAMVQPAYGPPKLNAVAQIRMDAAGRPYAFGADGNAIGNYSVLVRDSSKWKESDSHGASTGFCLTADGRSMMTSQYGLKWKDRTYNITGQMGSMPSRCEFIPGDSAAWVATTTGLLHAARKFPADTLQRNFFRHPNASDTVTAVAVIYPRAVWAATHRTVYRLGTLDTDTGITVWDSVTLLGQRVTGLKASAAGNRVWVGMDGITDYASTAFSTRGLRRHNGTNWTRYTSSLSSVFLPSDTIQALAIRDTASVWIAVKSGFYRFSGSASTPKVANLPAGVTVYDMVGDSQGFFAGTNLGVYQFRNDSLAFLGAPAVSLRPGFARERGRAAGATRLHVLSAAEARALGSARAVTGQRTGPQAGAGVYLLPEPASRPD